MCVIAQNVTVEVVYHNELFTACHVPILSMAIFVIFYKQ